MKLNSQRRKILLFLTTKMEAMTSHAILQYAGIYASMQTYMQTLLCMSMTLTLYCVGLSWSGKLHEVGKNRFCFSWSGNFASSQGNSKYLSLTQCSKKPEIREFYFALLQDLQKSFLVGRGNKHL